MHNVYYTRRFLLIKFYVRLGLSYSSLDPLLPLLLILSGSNEKPKPGVDTEKILRTVKDFK